MKRIGMVMVILALALGLAGCPDTKAKVAQRQIDLGERAKQYNECFFWRDYERASWFVVPDQRAAFQAFAEQRRQGYTLESFIVKAVALSAAGDQAAVTVQRSFVQSPSITLQSEVFNQRWVLVQGDWYLAGPPF